MRKKPSQLIVQFLHLSNKKHKPDILKEFQIVFLYEEGILYYYPFYELTLTTIYQLEFIDVFDVKTFHLYLLGKNF